MLEGNLIVIQGPTAVGKTDVAVKIASEFDTCVVSADSRQFYKEMTIGTAVPSDEELRVVKHYFIQDRSVKNHLSAGAFSEEALKCLSSIFTDKKVAVLSGGSGLYVNALVDGIDDLPKDDQLRESLNEKSDEELRAMLCSLDKESYEKIDLCNMQRVKRAIEVSMLTGEKYSELKTGGIKKHNMNVISIALNRPREELYDRINKRVDVMMMNGLEDEARKLYDMRSLPALQTVGYREMFSYFDGTYNYDRAVELIKQNTRHYAKRQMTWLRANKDITWFNPEDVTRIIEFIKKSLVPVN